MGNALVKATATSYLIKNILVSLLPGHTTFHLQEDKSLPIASETRQCPSPSEDLKDELNSPSWPWILLLMLLGQQRVTCIVKKGQQ